MLPTSIYSSSTHLGVKLLMGAHINAKLQKKFVGSYGVGKEKTVNDFRDLSLNDIRTVKEFINFMELSFGKYSKDNNLFYKTNSLHAFYRIWFDNKSYISIENMVKAFKKIFQAHIENWKDKINASGRVGCQLFYLSALESLNRISKQHYLSDTEIINQVNVD
jgi:hypothetical protein